MYNEEKTEICAVTDFVQTDRLGKDVWNILRLKHKPKKKNKSLQQKCSKGVDIKHQNQANFKRVFNFYLIKITNAEHVLPKVSNAISKVCHLHTPRTFPNPGT